MIWPVGGSVLGTVLIVTQCLAWTPQGGSLTKVKLESSTIRVGTPMRLVISVGHVSDVPLNITYVLPSGVRVSTSTMSMSRRASGETALTWRGVQSNHLTLSTEFSITTAGFYGLCGEIRLDVSKPGLIHKAARQIANHLPALSGSSADSARRREDYARSIRARRILEESRAPDPECYYIRASSTEGRAENWDFSTMGKRFSHWWSTTIHSLWSRLVLRVPVRPTQEE